MTGEIIAAMASDMNIRKFVSESDTEYKQRILYSALACWIKAAALDRNITDTSATGGVSKKHIYDKSSQILATMLERLPEIKPYFTIEEDATDPVHLIRQRLVQNGDLTNIGFDTDMTTVSPAVCALNSHIEHCQGVFFGNGVFYAGISSLRKKENEVSQTESILVTDWFDEFCDTAWWEIGSIENEDIEYFNCFKNARNVSSCWQNTPSSFQDCIRLLRITINKNMYEYYLEKEKRGIVYHHKIDPFLANIKEHRKMMFALRAKAGTHLPATIKKHTDHTSLKIWVHLPIEVAIFLESYAWPSRSITDILEWQIPLCLIDDVKRKLQAIGMKITEENYG